MNNDPYFHYVRAKRAGDLTPGDLLEFGGSLLLVTGQASPTDGTPVRHCHNLAGDTLRCSPDHEVRWLGQVALSRASALTDKQVDAVAAEVADNICSNFSLGHYREQIVSTVWHALAGTPYIENEP